MCVCVGGGEGGGGEHYLLGNSCSCTSKRKAQFMSDAITLALPVIVGADQCGGTTGCLLCCATLAALTNQTGKLWLLGGGGGGGGGGLHSIYNSL